MIFTFAVFLHYVFLHVEEISKNSRRERDRKKKTACGHKLFSSIPGMPKKDEVFRFLRDALRFGGIGVEAFTTSRKFKSCPVDKRQLFFFTFQQEHTLSLSTNR